jgi:hypothetical protein
MQIVMKIFLALAVLVNTVDGWTPQEVARGCYTAAPKTSCVGSLWPLRLRGGIGEGAGSVLLRTGGIAHDVASSEFKDFGSGPGHLDLSSTNYESMPTGINASDTSMDGERVLRKPITLVHAVLEVSTDRLC